MYNMKKIILIILLLPIISCTDWPNAPTKSAVINSFTSDASTITLGTSTTLRWDAQGSKGLSCRIDPLLGNVPTVGFNTINPIITTVYTLSCSIEGQGPAVRTLTVIVK